MSPVSVAWYRHNLDQHPSHRSTLLLSMKENHIPVSHRVIQLDRMETAMRAFCLYRKLSHTLIKSSCVTQRQAVALWRVKVSMVVALHPSRYTSVTPPRGWVHDRVDFYSLDTATAPFKYGTYPPPSTDPRKSPNRQHNSVPAITNFYSCCISAIWVRRVARHHSMLPGRRCSRTLREIWRGMRVAVTALPHWVAVVNPWVAWCPHSGNRWRWHTMNLSCLTSPPLRQGPTLWSWWMMTNNPWLSLIPPLVMIEHACYRRACG